MILFALASLAPLPLFAAGVWAGGAWALGVFLYMTAFAALLDQAIPYVAPEADEAVEFPGTDALLVMLAIGHLAAFPLTVWAIAGDSGLGFWEKAALFLGAGLWFGQVSNPMAHELIHRGNRWLFRLGGWSIPPCCSGITHRRTGMCITVTRPAAMIRTRRGRAKGSMRFSCGPGAGRSAKAIGRKPRGDLPCIPMSGIWGVRLRRCSWVT